MVINNSAIDVTPEKASCEASDLSLPPGARMPECLVVNGVSYRYDRPIRDEDGEEILGWRYVTGTRVLKVWND